MNNEQIAVMFVSTTCSSTKYDEVVKLRTKPSLDPSQRLFSAVLKGLCHEKCEVTCISARPFSSKNSNIKKFHPEQEYIDGIQYVYPSFRNTTFYRMKDLFFNTRNEVQAWINRNEGKKKVIICDTLVAMCSIPARTIANKKEINTVAYVTDYPTLATTIKGKRSIFRTAVQNIFDRIAEKDLSRYDAYIVVAKGLKELINRPNSPFLIIEDVITASHSEPVEKKNDKYFNIIYGGALCERFGINKLADAVMKIDNDRLRMTFYGSGESVEYIEQCHKKDCRIRYGGILSFGDLQVEQRRADLLVNPRPSNEIFANYSFPSKTLSYMLSGTPVLTTRIGGIPEDYEPYLLWFNQEDIESLSSRIDDITNISKEELTAFGKKAYEYAMNTKTQNVQCEKIKNFLDEIICC